MRLRQMKAQQKYKYIYTIKTNGVTFEVRAKDSTDALSIAKEVAKALRVLIVGVVKRGRV